MENRLHKTIEQISAQSNFEKENILTQLNAIELPAELTIFIDKYEKIGWSRDRFLWHWVWHLAYARDPGFMLSSVQESDRKTVALIKSLLVMAVTVVDDVADKLHDKALLDVLLKIPFQKVTIPDFFDGAGLFTVNLLTELIDTAFGLLKENANWASNEAIFMYDLKQVWNSFAYADLLNHNPEIINHTENAVYSGHNMMFYIFGDIDLIYSTGIDRAHDYSKMREIFWYAQQMTRIGNWVSTWERELMEKDVSSGVVSWAISNGSCCVQDIFNIHQNMDQAKGKINAVDIEGKLLGTWTNCRDIVMKIGTHVRSINVQAYVEGLELVMLYHLACKGVK